ncbi:hypothetical protein [Microbacterium sp. 77mftsu3.1]|uniref:hypothetical protein n=1 Tax=Microbacterium sp. 77mftsu3.1 TaxID=1761802 RepID=UPI00115F9518|nr:hypothetical protein [Microbacterium sp. 77mftsu3.1]
MFKFRDDGKRSQKVSVAAAAAATVFTISIACPTAAYAESDPYTEIANAVASSAERETITRAQLHSENWIASNEAVQAIGDESQVTLHFDQAAPVSIGLPTEMSVADVGISRQGSIAMSGDSESAALSVETVDDGVRIATVIYDASQSNRFTYPLEAGTGARVNADGSADIFRMVDLEDPESNTEAVLEVSIAHVEAPWAKDANGRNVATRYVVQSGALVQLVDHESAGIVYPVVADPKITRPNFFQTLVRWNRAETKTIAGAGWGATGLTAVCAAAGTAAGGPIGAAAFGAACLAIAGSGVYTAGVADNSSPKRCLQLTITFTVVTSPVPWFDTYKGGNCK